MVAVGVTGGVGVGIGGVGKEGRYYFLMLFADVHMLRVIKTFSKLSLFFVLGHFLRFDRGFADIPLYF